MVEREPFGLLEVKINRPMALNFKDPSSPLNFLIVISCLKMINT
jgi:hypothetical protein